MPAGVPDIVGCYKGRFFAFETKLPEKRTNTSVMQERMMEKIRAAGGKAQVVCTIQEAVDAMIAMKR
jgi:penicillin-binding protein-related factor A (putative recombinase)